MTKPALHIVFGDGAQIHLQDALTDLYRSDQIVCFQDDLSFGPINPPDATTRLPWIADQLDITDWDGAITNSEQAVQAALSDHIQPTIWFSRRSTRSYTGFLELLRRLEDRPCWIVDVSELKVSYRKRDGTRTAPQFAISPSSVPEYLILEHGLLDTATQLLPAERERYRQRWDRLRRENAPLRLILDGELVSAPLEHFDELLMSDAALQWRKVARLVSQALMKFWHADLDQGGDVFLASRVAALVRAGKLESQGNLHWMEFSEVRLPSQAASATP